MDCHICDLGTGVRTQEEGKRGGRKGERRGGKRGGKKGGQRKGSKRLQYTTYMRVVCHSLGT